MDVTYLGDDSLIKLQNLIFCFSHAFDILKYLSFGVSSVVNTPLSFLVSVLELFSNFVTCILLMVETSQFPKCF